MANEVIINIPGIGDVVAENAATEATLRDILAALGGRSGGGGSTGSGSAGSSAVDSATKSTVEKIKKVADSFDKFGANVIRSIDTFARLNGSVTSAASAVGDLARTVPLFGKTLEAAFTSVAAAQTDLIGSFQQASTSGAAFAGSLNIFAANASAASMTLQEYGQFVASHGEAMRALGGTTEEGARRFGILSKAMQKSSNDLYSLGFSTKELNDGLAKYAINQQYLGNLGKKSNTDLITGTKAYLKELDLLAKITGQSREQKADELNQLNVDVQFRAFIDSLGERGEMAGSALSSALGSIGPTIGGFVKDMVTAGVPTTEQNQLMFHAFSNTAAQAAEFGRALKDSNVSQDQLEKMKQKMLETASAEARAYKQGEGAIQVFGAGLDSLTTASGEMAKYDAELRAKAIRDQDAELNAREDSIRKFIDLQKAITEVGNSFTLVLAKSGVFDVLITAFNGLSKTIETFSVPLFKAFGAVMKSVSDKLSEWFQPFLESIGELSTYIPSMLSTAFGPLGGFLKDKFGDIFEQLKNSTGEGFDAKKIATKVTEWLGTGVNYLITGFRLLWNAITDVTARVQLYALSMDEMKINMLRFMIAMDTVASWLHISGAEKAKERHEGMLAWEEAVFYDTRKERKAKEDELHKEIAETTKKYKEINDDLTSLNNKVHESAQNVTPTSATEYATESEAISGQATAAGSSKISKGSKEYYNQVYNAILTSAKAKGVANPEIIARLGAAQSVQETGWGASVPAGSHNMFGIKGVGPAGSVEAWSPEEINGVVTKKKSAFKKYHSFEESAAGYVETLMGNKAYKDILTATTMPQAIAALGKSPYSTSSAYAGAVSKINASMQSQPVSSGLNVKEGATAGGKAEAGTMMLLDKVKEKLGGLFKGVTAINDEYHHKVNPTGGHAKGLKADIVITDPSKSAQAAGIVKDVFSQYGIKDYIVNDEYLHPSKNATGGHLDIGFKSLQASKEFEAKMAAQKDEAARKEIAQIDSGEKETQRVQQQEMQKEHTETVQTSADTHSQLLEQLLASMNELKEINVNQLSNQERHISIAQGQSNNVYAG